MTRKPPLETTDQAFLARIVKQNDEIIALLKRIAPTDDHHKLTGL